MRIVHSVGTTIIANQTAEAAAQEHSLSLATLWQLSATEYVTVEVFQNSGGALNVLASSAYSPEFWAVRVGV